MTVCAFLNQSGGQVLFRRDSGRGCGRAAGQRANHRGIERRASADRPSSVSDGRERSPWTAVGMS